MAEVTWINSPSLRRCSFMFLTIELHFAPNVQSSVKRHFEYALCFEVTSSPMLSRRCGEPTLCFVRRLLLFVVGLLSGLQRPGRFFMITDHISPLKWKESDSVIVLIRKYLPLIQGLGCSAHPSSDCPSARGFRHPSWCVGEIRCWLFSFETTLNRRSRRRGAAWATLVSYLRWSLIYVLPPPLKRRAESEVAGCLSSLLCYLPYVFPNQDSLSAGAEGREVTDLSKGAFQVFT